MLILPRLPSSLRLDWSGPVLRVRKNYALSTSPAPALYVCSTPIGHLGDVTLRLLDTLKMCDVIAAEDTRQTRKLLARYDIHPPELVSCHEHNQVARAELFVQRWTEGKTIALVSDAGTPLVSDPGWSVVDAAIEHDVPVIPLPGPSAVLAALVASRLPAQPFAFFGFLPRHQTQARQVLEAVLQFPGTAVLYESPHRVVQTLKRIQQMDPSRFVVLAKELTKQHETFIEGLVSELLDYCEQEPPRGEYVLMVAPSDTADGSSEHSDEELLAAAVAIVRQEMSEGTAHAEAVRRTAQKMHIPRRTLYQSSLDN